MFEVVVVGILLINLYFILKFRVRELRNELTLEANQKFKLNKMLEDINCRIQALEDFKGTLQPFTDKLINFNEITTKVKSAELFGSFLKTSAKTYIDFLTFYTKENRQLESQEKDIKQEVYNSINTYRSIQSLNQVRRDIDGLEGMGNTIIKRVRESAQGEAIH